jgi:hypothetical protein
MPETAQLQPEATKPSQGQLAPKQPIVLHHSVAPNVHMGFGPLHNWLLHTHIGRLQRRGIQLEALFWQNVRALCAHEWGGGGNCRKGEHTDWRMLGCVMRCWWKECDFDSWHNYYYFFVTIRIYQRILNHLYLTVSRMKWAGIHKFFLYEYTFLFSQNYNLTTGFIRVSLYLQKNECNVVNGENMKLPRKYNY